jgi:hypothetical protein
MKSTATRYCEEGCEAALNHCEANEAEKESCRDRYKHCVTECEKLSRPCFKMIGPGYPVEDWQNKPSFNGYSIDFAGEHPIFMNRTDDEAERPKASTRGRG